MSLPGAMFSQD